MTACRRFPFGVPATERTLGGYVRVPFGEHRIDAQGRKRGRKLVMLHRWIVEQVDGALPPWPESVVMHSCDTPDCFLYEHLSAGTYAENNQDCRDKGRAVVVVGEAHPSAVLTISDVRLIRSMRAEGASLSAITRVVPCGMTSVRIK